ncbi:hypothetical protein EYE35_21105 [Cereibacter sphaeroides]|nr:hypothetical protein EYE35_21105 [Cereibacter sphaeroides]
MGPSTLHLPIILVVAFAGCAPNVTGGTGRTTDGGELVGRLTGSAADGETAVEVISPQGWTCSGKYRHQAFDGTSTTVPLTCTDGRTGTGVIVFEKFALNFRMPFSLNDGTQGSVIFSFKG